MKENGISACMRVRQFGSCRSGNIALTFALALLPMIGMVGAAVDYSRVNDVKAGLQSAADTAALMLAKEAASDTPSALNANAFKYFRVNFQPHNTYGNLKVAASYSTQGGSAVLVNAQVDVPTTFMKLLGFQTLTVGTSSTSSWGSSRLRVSLVLDNTGSMAEAGKMGALKNATKNLLQQLQSAADTNGDVYVSIVPFSKDVNVGAANKKAKWIDWSVWNGTNGSCTTSGTNGDGADSSQYADKKGCQSHGYVWVPTKGHGKWNGCITDRINFPIPNGTTDYDQSSYEAGS